MSTAAEIMILKEQGERALREISYRFGKSVVGPMLAKSMRMTVKALRPKGYSQSHWRKIVQERRTAIRDIRHVWIDECAEISKEAWDAVQANGSESK